MSDRIPTLADVCSAIADGHVAASIDGCMYEVNALELRRYLDKFHSLPTVSSSIMQKLFPSSVSTPTPRTSSVA
jgi:hypothetical protein